MGNFRKRIYQNPWNFAQDIGFILKNLKRVRALVRGESLSPAFRERMMLAVTRVNDCRYCARFHSKIAVDEGISREEVEAMLKGIYEDCPAGEIIGVLYAEHWAETSGAPDAAMRDKLLASYGQAMVNDIDVVLRVIKTGNLTGNTVDYWVYRLSFGRWGLPRTAQDGS
jgi:AhpD family alkylhydroperoxidase